MRQPIRRETALFCLEPETQLWFPIFSATGNKGYGFDTPPIVRTRADGQLLTVRAQGLFEVVGTRVLRGTTYDVERHAR